MNPRLVQTTLVYVVAAVLMILLIDELRKRGGPFFHRPFTVEDHTWVGENSTRDALALCKLARPFMRRNATVTLLRPSQAPNFEATIYLSGVGNLPHQIVVAPRLELNVGNLPDYVIALREPLTHPAYEKRAGFAEGALYERRR